jgi:hypothetical protein
MTVDHKPYWRSGGAGFDGWGRTPWSGRLPATPASCGTVVTFLEAPARNAPSSTRIVPHQVPASVCEPCRPCARNKTERDQPFRDGFRCNGDTNKPPCASDPGQHWQPRRHINAERAKQDTSRVVRRVRNGRGVIVGKFVGDQSALKRPERMVPGSDRVERDTPAPTTLCEIFDLVSKVL